MGQTITVESKQAEGFCVFTTDRSLTGQDGARFGSREEAESAADFPGILAARLFASDDSVDHVYIASNDVIVGRSAEWDSTSIDAAATTIKELFRFYE